MKKIITTLICASSFFTFAEKEVNAPITKIAIFKNGIAAITRDVKVDDKSPFFINKEILPLYGSFWFEPLNAFTVSKVNREVQQINYSPMFDVLKSYEGKKVTVKMLNGNQIEVYSGVMLNLNKKTPVGQDIPENMQYFWLKNDEGIIALSKRNMTSIIAKEYNEKILQNRDVLLFTPLEKMKVKNVKINYLTTGITWAPAYKINLLNKEKLLINFSAVIENKLENLENAEVSLVTGFANFKCAGILSPLAIFWKHVNEYSRASKSIFMNNQSTSHEMSKTNMSFLEKSPATSGIENSDIQYMPPIKLSMKYNEATFFPIDSAECEYQSIVDYTITDKRDNYGRYSNHNDKSTNDLWEILRFKNPFKVAITTAPIEILEKEKVLSQSETVWVNPQQETDIKLTKALSVTGKNIEYEITKNDDGKTKQREEVYYMSNRYYKTQVKGEITLKNYRQTSAKVEVKISFSGELNHADGEFSSKLLERGVYSVNAYNQIKWFVELEANQELNLNYVYTVLVNN